MRKNKKPRQRLSLRSGISKRISSKRLSRTRLSRLLLISGFLGLWASSILFVYMKVKCPPPPPLAYQSEPLFPIDTVVTRCWEFEGFQLYLNHITGDIFSGRNAFTSVHINSSNESYFLFYTHEFINEMGAEPIRLFDDIYAYKYYTGGNYSRSSGFEIFRMNEDTAIYFGPVVGYDDIDEDGEKEFWLFVLAETGEGAAFNKFEKLKVEFTGDSLIYPYLDGAY